MIAGHRCLTHGGGMVGYSTFLLADVSAGVGVIVLTYADGDNLHAQLLARAAHTDLVSRLSGATPPELPPADPRARPGACAIHPDWLGRFLAGPSGPAGTAAQPEGAAEARRPHPPTWHALTGHYRCYSPWYPELRIFVREDVLWLAAPGGVEAPGQDEQLIELEPGVFRIGVDEWLPERLVAGPVVGGRVISLAPCR